MKRIKKIFALLVAMVMVLGMSTAVFAASDGTITIQNTVKDKSYEVYKVFDATYSGTNVSYTYDGSNSTFLAALQNDSSPFTADANTSGTYNIALKENKTASDVSAFLTAQKANLGNAVKTATGNGTTQTLTELSYGYYYITTTTGSVVTIDSALKDVTVIDKNEVIPPPDKSESVDGGNAWTEEPETGDESTTANVGDTVNYKVTGSFNRYQGETLVTNLTFSDTMTEGLTPNKDVVIKINGQKVDVTLTYSNNDRTWKAVIPTVTVADDQTITFLYDTPSTYEITYSAVINEDAVVASPDSNTFTLFYNNDVEGGIDITKVVSYQITLTKVDKEEHALAGAEFELYDAKTEGNEIPVVLVTGENDPQGYGTKDSPVDNVYRHAKTGEDGVRMITGTTGKVVVQGLANGTYYFEEKEAPEGFNKLTARTDATTILDENATISVLNQSGIELPSTGGMGTTIFYVLGAILVLGAGVLLITKRRMSR